MSNKTLFIHASLTAVQVEVVRSGLTASIFVRHPETGELFVNFDPQILTLIHETECMGRLGMEIPALAKTLRAQQDMYKELYNSMIVSRLL